MCACALPSLHSLVEMDIHSCQCTLSFTLRHTHARVYGTTSLATVHMHEPMYSQSEALTNHATLVSLRTEHLPPATGVTDRRDPVRLPPIVTAPKDFGVASDGAPPPSLGLQTGVTCPASSDRHGARSPKAPSLDQGREFVQSIAPPHWVTGRRYHLLPGLFCTSLSKPRSGSPRSEAMTLLCILEVQFLVIARHFCDLLHGPVFA